MVAFAMRSAGSIGLVIALAAALGVKAFAQQSRTIDSADELLKSIGLRKPAMSAAPDFNLLDTSGTPVALSGYRGKVVLLNFWATWCGPCKEEMPSMERLARKFAEQGLVVLAVNQRENAALVDKFMKTQGLNFTAPLDTTGRVAGYYRVYGIPVSYLVDRGGRAIGMKSGSMDWASPSVFDVFQKLLGDGSSGGATAGSMDLEPRTRLPRTLRARADGTALRAQQDRASEVVGKLGRGDEVIPLGKVTGAGDAWYMVKTKSGAVGWVRLEDMEDTSSRH